MQNIACQDAQGNNLSMALLLNRPDSKAAAVRVTILVETPCSLQGHPLKGCSCFLKEKQQLLWVQSESIQLSCMQAAHLNPECRRLL